MKTINAYKTSDDEIFETLEAAEYHEMLVSEREIIEDFLRSNLNNYKGHAHKAMARTAIINWEIWKGKNVK
jgi:hypothetical protein